MNHYTIINGQKIYLELKGRKHGDQLMSVGEQCEGCGTALDAEGEAYLFDKYGRHEVQCGVCGTCFPIRHEDTK